MSGKISGNISGKILWIAFITIICMSGSVARADTRADAAFATAKVESPASEKRCLEAFVNSNFVYAHRLCLSLAQQGMRDAQLVTGLLYVYGEGTEKNPAKAKIWLREALRNGSEEAREILKEFHLND